MSVLKKVDSRRTGAAWKGIKAHRGWWPSSADWRGIEKPKTESQGHAGWNAAQRESTQNWSQTPFVCFCLQCLNCVRLKL